MASGGSYKNRRGTRTSKTDTTFSNGMMYSENNVNEGYAKTLVNFDFENDNKVLTPRAGLRTRNIIMPDFNQTFQESDPFFDDDVSIQAAKECVEDGTQYQQIILGLRDEDINDGTGTIWFSTTDNNYKSTEVNLDEDKVLEVDVNACELYTNSKKCTFFNTDYPEIHDIKLARNRKFSNVIGTFGFLNSFYFFGIDTVQNTDVTSLYHTVFNSTNHHRYEPEKVTVKSITASEAVNYGYNMLSSSPYEFSDTAIADPFEMLGILPYDAKFDTGTSPNLLMSPKYETKIWFRCNYDVASTNSYKIVWSWKELSADEWTVFFETTDESPFNSSGLPKIQASFVPPLAEILVRCEAYRINDGVVDDAVEKAMTVGFDFTIDENDTNRNMQPDTYNLTTAKGMVFYKNRIALYGLPKDPTILFFSDYNEPGYFPYPNNIVTFDEPIIHAVSFMDSLIVFTTNKIHQVRLNEDGNSWTTEVVQSNLYIEPYDKHLVQTVRNMLYFKSGNYYYMMVPKSTSTTGELTLAPITTPITSFFDNFSSNVSKVLQATYNRNDVYELVTYYNFLDYEFIHNIYVFGWGDDDTFIHFDVMYNTNTRYWKICVFENPGSLFPYKNDATQYGLLASTSVNTFRKIQNSVESRVSGRLIQLFCFDKNHPKDFYFPSDILMIYYPNMVQVTVDVKRLLFPALATVSGKKCTIDNAFVELPVKNKTLRIAGSYSYDKGFKISDFEQYYNEIINSYSTYFTYRNYQFLDTGYTAQDFVVNKRYRELQLQICNHSNKNLMFRFDFLVAGEPRRVVYKYEFNQMIDELNPNYGLIDVDPTPVAEIDHESYYQVLANDVDLTNDLVIDEGLFPNIDYWKIRANVTGKGVSPRFRLNSRNEVLFQILSLNWIYRIMNMR